MVAPVHPVLASIRVARAGQKLGGVAESQLLFGNAKAVRGVGCVGRNSQLVRFRVHMDVGGVCNQLGGIAGLDAARKIQHIALGGSHSAEKGLLIGVKQKFLAVVLQQVVLENSAFMVGNKRKHRRRRTI